MSSIRPLATITLLMLAGLFLWWKINETEPVIPEGVGDYPVAAALEIGGGDGSNFAAAPTSESYQSDQYAAGDTAPAYTPGAVSDDDAPAWKPPQDSAARESAAPQDDVPIQAAAPEMPAVPSVAGAAAEESAVDASAADRSVAEETEEDRYGQQVVAGGMAPHIADEPAGQEPLGQDAAADPYEQLAEDETSNNSASIPAEQAAAPAEPAAATTPTPQTSLFAATRVAVQAALDRGQLSQALLLLSDWYGDPSLTPEETDEVNNLLSQLAGSVIYSVEHRLEPPYMVQAGETLQQVAAKYNVPWQLLAKINGIAAPDQLRAGQQLKVVSGPFSAKVDVSSREMVLWLGRRYAGRFKLDVTPDLTVEDGSWMVDQKLLTPVGGMYSTPEKSSETPSLVLSNPANAGGQVALVRGPADANQIASEPSDRTLRLNPEAAQEVYDILSIGSRITIQK